MLAGRVSSYMLRRPPAAMLSRGHKYQNMGQRLLEPEYAVPLQAMDMEHAWRACIVLRAHLQLWNIHVCTEDQMRRSGMFQKALAFGHEIRSHGSSASIVVFCAMSL